MPSIFSTMKTWADMIKFAHSVFALPFAFIAVFLAGTHLDIQRPYAIQMLLILICMVSARSVAMTFNRIIDAELDARNPRTANRPLPAGILTRRSAWVFLILCAGAFGVACYGFHHFFENPWPILLAPTVLVYICGYSYSKRFTQWSHFYLGSALGIAPLAAWLAIDPASLGWTAVLLSLAVVLWVAGFDVIYACQDIEVDRRDGLLSLPSRVGPKWALRVTRVCHAGVVLLLVAVGLDANLRAFYFSGVGGVAVLLIIENRLVSADDFSRINVAFFTINGMVGIVLGVLTILDVLIFRMPA